MLERKTLRLRARARALEPQKMSTSTSLPVRTTVGSTTTMLTTTATVVAVCREVASGLALATGLSSTFARAAASLETRAKMALGEVVSLASVRVASPASVDEATQMRHAGVSLFNAVRKGPQTSEPALRLRHLACNVMAAAGVSLEDATRDELDLSRAFATTGVLLMNAGLRVEGDVALRAALEPDREASSTFLERVVRVFANSQEAHDAAAAHFAALISHIGDVLSELGCATTVKDNDAVSEQQERQGISALGLLGRNRDLVESAVVGPQRALRDALEQGACALVKRGLVTAAAPFLEALVGDFEFLAAAPGQRARARATLAVTLARLGETASATRALDRRGEHEAHEPAPPSSLIWLGERVARCAISLARVRDERTGGGGDVRVEEAKRHATADFASLLSGRTIAESFATEAGARLVLDSAAELCREVDWACSFGALLAAATGESAIPALEFQTLNWAYLHGGDTGREGVLATLRGRRDCEVSRDDGSGHEARALAALGSRVWDDAARAYDDEDWPRLFTCAQLVARLARGSKPPSSDGSVSSSALVAARADVAAAIAVLHKDLPDPDGSSERERATLARIDSLADGALTTALVVPATTTTSSSGGGATIEELRASAATLRLRALARLSALSTDSDERARYLATCAEVLHTHGSTLRSTDSLRAACDASRCGAHAAAIATLEHARDRLVVANPVSPFEELLEITRRLVEARARSSDSLSIVDQAVVQDVAVLLERIDKEGTRRPVTDIVLAEHLGAILGILLGRLRLHSANDNDEDVTATILEHSARLADALGGREADADRTRVAATAALLRRAARIAEFARSTASLEASRLARRAITLLEAVRPVARDEYVGGLAVLATIFAVADTAEPDHVADESINKMLAHDFPRVATATLLAASRVAAKTRLVACSRGLAVRVVRGELSRERPEYALVADALTFTMRLASNSPSRRLVELEEAADQFETLRRLAGSELAVEALEFAAVTLWGLHHSEDRVLAARAAGWLDEACRASDAVLSRREAMLRGMRAMLTEPAIEIREETNPTSASTAEISTAQIPPSDAAVIVRRHTFVVRAASPACKENSDVDGLEPLLSAQAPREGRGRRRRVVAAS